MSSNIGREARNIPHVSSGSNEKTTELNDNTTVPTGDSKEEAMYNLGNPVFSAPTKVDAVVPPLAKEQDNSKGCAKEDLHPMYMTSTMEYGNRQPSVHVMPQTFHAKSQKFSEHLGQCGMFRNYSLNTSVDKNPVSSQLDGLF